MFLKNSRYLTAMRFAANADGSLPFKGVRPRDIMPAPGMVEHTLQRDERFDWLGTHYFNDSRLWWRIIDANADVLCSLELEAPGMNPPPGLSGPTSVVAEDAQGPEFGAVVLIPRAKD